MSADDFELVIIRHLMSALSSLQVGNAQLHRLGDQATSNITKVSGDNSLTEPQMMTVFDMLIKAFERPAAILKPANRQPKAISFLL
jgi:hypothetical protein